MNILAGLEPSRVFYYFEMLCGIPHGSYHTKELSDYCVFVAKKLGLTVQQDEWMNVVIKKPASKGCENAPVLMLQGHLDMVCEKEPDSIHDFEKDGLQLLVQDGYVTAKKTTLGGDDGIAVAICLAILEDDTLQHPPLEIVLTTEEEVGMEGAIHLDTTDLEAEYLINLDSEEEGVLTAGCAGGSTLELHLPYTEKTVSGLPYTVTISGLAGGHSGVEIQKGRANSNRLMGQLLTKLSETTNYELCFVNGGKKHNVIPNRTTAGLVFPDSDAIIQAEGIVSHMQTLFTQAYEDTEAGIQVKLEPMPQENKTDTQVSVLDSETKTRLLYLMTVLPNGVQAMSQTVPGLPETSLNLGVLCTRSGKDPEIYIEISNRSSNHAALVLLEQQLTVIGLAAGCTCQIQSAYPGWSYRKDSKLRELMLSIYRKLFKREMEIEVIHAGLECGILASKLPDLDIVSVGPDILDIHTPQERLSIASVARTYDYIREVIQTLSDEKRN